MSIRDIFQSVDKGTRRFATGINYISIVGLGVLALGIIMHVTMRYVFRSPLTWGEEFGMIFTVVITFAGVPLLFHNDGHLRIKVLYNILPKKVQVILDIIVSVVAIAFLIFWSRYSFGLFGDIVRRGVHYNTMRQIPVWPEYLFIAVILAISVGIIFIILVRHLFQLIYPTEETLKTVEEVPEAPSNNSAPIIGGR